MLCFLYGVCGVSRNHQNYTPKGKGEGKADPAAMEWSPPHGILDFWILDFRLWAGNGYEVEMG